MPWQSQTRWFLGLMQAGRSPPSRASVSPSVNWAEWEELRGWWSLHLALSFPLPPPCAHTHPYHREATTQGSLEMAFIGVPKRGPASRAASSLLFLVPVGDDVAQGLVVDVPRQVHGRQGEHLLHLEGQ